MKKLNKLSINPDKVIKNEELVNLKGGGDCVGHYYICDSNWEQFQEDYYANCGSGSDVEVSIIMGC
jgi:hypothetical protein